MIIRFRVAAGVCVRRILQQSTPSASNACPRCIQQIQRLQLSCSAHVKSVWGPVELNKRPLIPEYDTINMKMYSYDFTVLESFASYTKRLATILKLDFMLYPVPRQTHVIKTYMPYSTTVKDQYTMDKYERVIRIHNLQSTKLPLFIEIMRANIPSGIDIQFKQHSEEDETIRYMGDQEKKDVISKLEQIAVKKS